MSERIDVLEAIVREMGLRRASAEKHLEAAQRIYDEAQGAYDRACSALGAAIEETA